MLSLPREASMAVSTGAMELDMVINYPLLKQPVPSDGGAKSY